jgi:hypothetical protein
MRNINVNAKYRIYFTPTGWWCSGDEKLEHGMFLRIKEKEFGRGGPGSYCKSFRQIVRILKETVKDGDNWSFADEYSLRNYKVVVKNNYAL